MMHGKQSFSQGDQYHFAGIGLCFGTGLDGRELRLLDTSERLAHRSSRALLNHGRKWIILYLCSSDGPGAPTIPVVPMSLTVDQFVRRLVEAELFARPELDGFIGGLASRPTDGEQLAKELVLQQKLTKYQARVAYAGDGKTLVLGNYVVLDNIGAGGMGEVFLSRHRRLGRKAALKVLPAKVTDNEDAVRRFHREVQAISKLSHPNIVGAFDAGESNGTHYFVMEYVPGRDLASIVKKEGPLSVDRAVDCIMQAAAGLEYAHRQKVIHRDIKPANLLLVQSPESRVQGQKIGSGLLTLDSRLSIKILDLGLARFEQADHDSVQTELTNTGAVMGTVDYMAPEQALNTKNADARSDVYSLGCSLWYLLTGRSLYTGDSVIEKVLAHRDSPIPSLTMASPAVNAVFQKMVAKKPADRFQSMAAVVGALQACRVAEPVSSTGDTTAGTSLELRRFLDGIDQPETVAYVEPSPPADTPTEQLPVETMNLPQVVDTFSLGLTKRPHKTLRDHLTNRRVQLWSGIGLALFAGVILLAAFSGGEGNRDTNGERNVRPNVGTSKSQPAKVVRKTSTRPPTTPNYTLSFDGKDDGVTLPDLRYVGGPYTIEGWIELSNPKGIVLQFQGDKSRVSIGPFSGDNRSVRLSHLRVAGGGKGFSAFATIRTGSLVHIAGTWNGRVGALFVNGTRVVRPWFPSQGTYRIGTNPSFFGGLWRKEGVGNPFLGRIDEVRISNTARYTKDFTPAKRFTPDKDTLALYHFDEGSGDVLKDSSGNNHHGKIHGATWVKEVTPGRWVPYDADRAAAEWVLSLDGRLKILAGDVEKRISRAADLPSSPFQVVGIDLLNRGAARAKEVTDGELARLKPLKNLKSLQLYATRVTDAGLSHLKGLKSLTVLILRRTGVSDAGLPLLKELSNLTTLSLQENFGRITDQGLSHLASMTQLTDLNLGATLISDSGLKHLKPLTRLTTLSLSKTRVSDVGLRHLESCKSLKRLDLLSTRNTSADGVSRLRKALPGCKVLWSPPPDRALSFDGKDDYVEIPKLHFDGGKPFTVEVWVEQNQRGGKRAIFRSHGPRGGCVIANWPLPNGIGITVSVSNDRTVVGGLGGRVRIGLTHIAVVRSQDGFAVFANGRKIDDKAGPEAQRTQGKGPTFIGARRHMLKGPMRDFFSGTISELRVSTVARYTKDFTPAKRFTPDKNTLALYHFDEGAGDVLNDSSGNNHHGVIYGATWVNADGSPVNPPQGRPSAK